jgi:hypothetical protein
MTYRFGQIIGVDAVNYDAVYESMRSDIDQRNTPLALHDPDSNDVKLARQQADEMINVSGATVTVYTRTNNSDYDTVWDEDPDPTYWNPVQLKGFYKPNPIEMELNRWGLDTTNKTDIIFSHRQLYELLGDRMLRIGDVVQIPYNAVTLGLRNYRILNVTPSGQFRYIWLYYTCQLELLTADITVRPEGDMQTDDDLPSGGVYRESL